MVLSLLALIFLSILPISQTNTITSCAQGTTCNCNDNEPCTVNCNGDDSCRVAAINVNAASSITFSCNGEYACYAITVIGPTTSIPFVITCTGSTYACYQSDINAGNASSFDLYCDGNGAMVSICKDSTINCGSGTGKCTIHCIGKQACSVSDINCGSASECGLLCDSGWTQSCSGLKLNCGNSVCWMQCGGATNACYANQPPVTTNAISFICNGASCDTEYINALKTVAPTISPTSSPSNPTIDPTIAPTISPTSSPSNPTIDPTIDPTIAPSQPTYSPSKAPSNSPSNNPTTDPTIEPTSDPSAAPTQSPSVSPTYSPSKAPSNNPTTDPIADPTIDPTTDPTADPTIDPTSDPTTDPTIDPTRNPSDAPTQHPSVSPTYSPSKAPSSAPTQPPTTCADINPLKATNDGRTNHTISEIYGTFRQKNIINDYNVTYYTNPGFGAVINCHDAEICYIKCTDDVSCGEAIISPKNKYLSQLIVECMGQYGCYQSVINITEVEVETVSIVCSATASCKELVIITTNSTMDAMTIWCNEKDSCSSLDIVISTSLIDIFTIYCIDEWSCYGINAELRHSPQLNTNILCPQHHSCDSLHIQSDGDIFINLSIYQYSSDIFIIHPDIKHINIRCADPKNKRYFKYNTQELMNERQIIDVARSEYDTHQMPCDDVWIQCTSNPHFPQKCQMSYHLKPLNLSHLLTTNSYIECYWLEINDAFNVRCDGNCGDDMMYYQYAQWIDFDIGFDTNIYNESSVNKMVSICETYFGSINKTEDTLNSIDSILEQILFIGSIQNSFKINDIIKSPESILRDGLSAINCSESFKLLLITTETVIESATDNTDEFDQLFNEESQFMIQAQQLLSAYFKTPIIFKRLINSINNEESSRFDFILWTLLSFVALFVILTVCGFIYNEIPNSRVDDSRFNSIFVFGASVFDFASDIILSIEITKTLYSTDSESVLLSITAYGSIIFIILPFIINIMIAINIKRYINNNYAAKLYFERYSVLFISLVILCGASYPVLSLLSSRIFGKEIFNAGLTRYELKRLSSMKIYASVIMENAPQLILQLLFVVYLGGIPSENTILAFIGSLLSIVITILSHIMDRNGNNGDIAVIEYDIEMIIDHNLCKEEKTRIFLKKERKRSLQILLAPSLEIKMRSLEFGYVTLTKKGCIIHCVHYVFKHESLKDSALLFVERLYESQKEAVIESFAKHFKFDKDEIDILFHQQFRVNVDNKQSIKLLIDELNKFKEALKRLNGELNAEQINDEHIDKMYHKLVDQGFDKKLIEWALKDFIMNENDENDEKQHDEIEMMEINDSNDIDIDEELDYLEKMGDIITMNKANKSNDNENDKMIQNTQETYGEVLNDLGVISNSFID